MRLGGRRGGTVAGWGAVAVRGDGEAVRCVPWLGGEPRCILQTVPSQAGRAFLSWSVNSVLVLYFHSVL